MAFTFPSLLEFGLEASAEVLTHGFADYFVPIRFNAANLAGMARTDSVDLAASRVAVLDGTPVGAALIARRGWTCRLAGMSIVSEARRRGVGRTLMTQLLAEARARAERTMVLEVIEQNEPAVKLYETLGFEKVRRLTGHAGKPNQPADMTGAGLEEIDPRELARLISEHGLPELPWQISAETIAHAAAPEKALRLGPSALLLAFPKENVIQIRALVTERAARGQGHSLALLYAAMARYPDHEWRASAIFPEEMGEAFTAAGLVRIPLSQWQMVRLISTTD